MKTGLEEFLKRIEAKPTNETLIDRFMTLVLEEDGVERILYLKSLVGLLLKSNPYAALKAAYVELQEARKEKLSNEYEIGALKDVESCFLNLGRNDNAALVREEITKLSAENTVIQSIQKPTARPAASPAAKPAREENEFPVLPSDDDNVPALAPADRTRMTPPPAQHTVMTDMAKTFESPSVKPFEKKPLPNFPAAEPKAAAPAPKPSPSPKSKPVPAHMTPAPPPEELNSDVVNSQMFQPKGSNLDPGFGSPVHERTRATPIQIPSSKPSSTSIPLESSFHEDENPFMDSSSDADEEAANEDGFGFNFEYSKRGPIESGDKELGSIGTVNGLNEGTMGRTESPTKARTTQSGFSLRDEIGEPSISAASGIDESFENQPFFQPDDDDDETPPPAERTILISLEKLNESKEQINLAKGSSANVKDVNYPVNSGPNFVVLDSDDDDTATDLPAASEMPTEEELVEAAGANDFGAVPFDPDALNDQAYSPGAPFAYEADPVPASSGTNPRATQAPFNLEADFPFVQDASADSDPVSSASFAPGASPFAINHDPVLTYTPDPTPSPFSIAEEDPAPFVMDDAMAAPFIVESAPTITQAPQPAINMTIAPQVSPIQAQAPQTTVSPQASPFAQASVQEQAPVQAQAPQTTQAPQASPFAQAPSQAQAPQATQAPVQAQAPQSTQPPQASPFAQAPQSTQPPQASPFAQAPQTTQPPQASPFAQAQAPTTTHSPQPSPLSAQAPEPMHIRVDLEPKQADTFEITPQAFIEPQHTAPMEMSIDDNEDTDIAYRYKDSAESKQELEEFDEEPVHIHLIPTPSIVSKWTVVQERLKLFSGLQIGRSHAVDFVKRLLNAKTETPVVLKTLNLLLQFVEAKLDKALCTKMAAWLFEELKPSAMHQLWDSLNLKNEGLELFLDYITDLEQTNQYRRSLSIMHDILRFELEMNWYVESYPHLMSAWEKLGLDGWIWLEEEGSNVFCDRLARREDPMLATLLI